MCQFQHLYNNDAGYIIRCKDCRYYQVLFNGIVLSLNEREYQKFLDIIASCENDIALDEEQHNLFIPTPRQGVHLFLSANEINELKQMMESADSENKALSLLELFHR